MWWLEASQPASSKVAGSVTIDHSDTSFCTGAISVTSLHDRPNVPLLFVLFDDAVHALKGCAVMSFANLIVQTTFASKQFKLDLTYRRYAVTASKHEYC